jgi:excinuclease ABC subunit C
MTAVRAILEELGIEDQVHRHRRRQGAGPRGRARALLHEGQGGFSLPPRDPVLYFVQRLRDEAHRFAIGSHRARRKKEMVKNPLDEIGGIGPTRKRCLLQHFGTAKAVPARRWTTSWRSMASRNRVARLVYNHFHDNG